MVIFDDHRTAAFYPLALSRSVCDIRCGILKLRQRLEQFLGDDEDTQVWMDPALEKLYQKRQPLWILNQAAAKGSLLVNSRLKVDQESIDAARGLLEGQCLMANESILALKSNRDLNQLPKLSDLGEMGFELIESELYLYQDLSDLIHDNERLLRFDFDRLLYDSDNYFETEPGVTALNPYSIWIGEDVNLKPGVVLDASDGPIVLDQGVQILANAVIMGPAFIGKNSLVKVGAKIYGGSSIGPVCKVGGEIENSIFQAYSNKQHDGFLGHSIVGEWVNIGADTNNSDLKNTYRNVSYHSYLEGGRVDSGKIFLGSMIGDHAKLGINVTLNTGSVIGVGSNLWGSDLISGFVPDFSWGTAGKYEKYRFDRFCDTAAAVKARRGLEFGSQEKELFEAIYARREN